MRVSLGLLLILGIWLAHEVCHAEQFYGLLARVDRDSITLLSPDNQKVIFHVDKHSRCLAAPFLGRWVTVDAELHKLHPKTVGLEPKR
jgi:hypothetical protein